MSRVKFETTRTLFLTAACACALVACGGGGGSAPAPTVPVATPAPAPAPAPGVNTPMTARTSVPAAAYPSDPERLSAFNRLNELRALAGLGLLAQSAAVDQAAQSHTVWMATPGNGLLHLQRAGSTGFTGVHAIDRARAAGYTPAADGRSVNEIARPPPRWDRTPAAARCRWSGRSTAPPMCRSATAPKPPTHRVKGSA